MTKSVRLIGNPIGHSKSPEIHNAGYQELELNYNYSLMPIEPQDLEQAVEQLKDPKIAGFNVTIPYKQTVIPYLDELDSEAEKIGAVNTVVNRLGKLIGYNTDGKGFIKALEHYHKFEIKNKKIAIYGSGGAARAIVISCFNSGARELSIGAIDMEQASSLAKSIDDFAYDLKSSEFSEKVASADLVINATPVGMSPNSSHSVVSDPDIFQSGQLAFDAVYNPGKTMFLKQAESQGARIAYGFEMLLFQAVLGFEMFTASKAPISVMEKALKTSLKL